MEFKFDGWCPICDQQTQFVSKHSWFRDHLLCSQCGSIPRERALMKVIKEFYPDYKTLTIHESSPCGRGVSELLRNECQKYSYSHYFPNVALGKTDPTTQSRCENLEKLTFEDDTFDLIITQDVMEHVFNPAAAFSEIARVLKPGVAHIFTVPIMNKVRPTERRASLLPSGEIEYHFEPEYHGNPIDANGSLVTFYWGYDIASYIQQVTEMPTIVIQIDNIDFGIRADYIEVIVSTRSDVPDF
jgi:SAM-dependent methyltransferase